MIRVPEVEAESHSQGSAAMPNPAVALAQQARAGHRSQSPGAAAALDWPKVARALSPERLEHLVEEAPASEGSTCRRQDLEQEEELEEQEEAAGGPVVSGLKISPEAEAASSPRGAASSRALACRRQ
mmetsp:Transcript_26440/g.59681  ORF Transcript_26440/g.59681 Transcript_26440/m.59681 type:complete len:127 (+) Transcript_26440:81-461(+)